MNSTTQGIRIVTWNAATLPTRIGELREFVSRHEPDIILVQETQLRPNNRVTIPNFICYRDDKEAPTQMCPFPKHGTAIFIRNTIPHDSIPSPNLVHIQATILRIKPQGLHQFHIASVYVKNKPSKLTFPDELETLVAGHNSLILGGDFNAHHRRWTSNYNPAGSMLSNFADTNSFEVLAPPTPTRYGYRSQTTIDLFLIRDIPYHHDIRSIPELSSDHNPVLCDFYTNVELPRAGTYKNTNWGKFQEEMDNSIGPIPIINSADDLDKATKSLSATIIKAHNSASKEVSSEIDIYTPFYIRQMIKEKTGLGMHGRGPGTRQIKGS